MPNSKIDILKNYEVLPNEPMHDIAVHWKNLLEEIPRHLSQTVKLLFQSISMIGLNKDSKHAAYYRKTAINLYIPLKGKISDDIYKIILTGYNMQEEERNMSLF